MCPVTACASGAHAIGEAMMLIERGHADMMIAGATEASVDALSLAGFGRMRALATSFNDQPGDASRPFDTQREGFVLAGMHILSFLYLVLSLKCFFMNRGCCGTST
jgi:3-oxoacyl-[acyl-carrier-protein] synthase II